MKRILLVMLACALSLSLSAQGNSKSRQSPSNSKNKKNEAPAPEPDPEVMTLYYSLPLEYLPQLKNYLEKERENIKNEDFKDGKDFRKSYIRKVDGDKGYLFLQRLGETRYTRVQEFKSKDQWTVILAVETTSCSGTCENDIKFYSKNGDDWTDVTDRYKYQYDPKYVMKALKDKYKEEYLDLDIYNTHGYDQPENLNKAITYNISNDEPKIIIKEQYLPLPLYEMVWDASKNKFDVKKL